MSSTSRPQGRWSPLTGRRRTDRDALQVGTAAREERMHPQPRQRDRREWRDDPTRTNTSGRSHHVTVEGSEMRSTGFPSKDTDTHRPSVHAQAREARPAQALTGTHALGACSRPGSPARAASTHSPCSVATLRGREGLHDGSKNRHRLQTEQAGEDHIAESVCVVALPLTTHGSHRASDGQAAGVDADSRVGGQQRHEAGWRT